MNLLNIVFSKISFKNMLIFSLILAVLWLQFKPDQGQGQLYGTGAHTIAAGVAQGKTDGVTSIDRKNVVAEILGATSTHSLKSKSDIISSVDGKWSKRENESSKNVDKYKIKKKQIWWIDSATGQSMPIGVTLYSPKKDADGKNPWIAKAYNLEFHTQVIRSIDRDGRVHNTISLTARPKNIKGFTKDFPLKIDLENTLFQEVINDHNSWSLWNPKLSFGINNRAEFVGKINVINYGNQIPVWQILSPEISLNNNKAKLGLEIVSYNLGEVLPVISDLHLGLGVDINKTPSISLTTTF